MDYRFKGIISEPMISYNDDKSIDFETTAKIFHSLASRGASGLFINGFGDETYSLSLQERLDVIKCGLEATKGTGCEVVGVVMVTCLQDALWLIKEYEKLGVTAISISPPPFYELTEKALYDYLATQLNSTKLDAMLYNCREMDELVSPELLGKLAHDCRNLKGYKDATRNPIHLTYCKDALDDIEDFCLLSGCDATFYMHLKMGATGTVSFMSVPFLDQMKDIYDNFMAGNDEAAWQAQRKVLVLRNQMYSFPDSCCYIYSMKYTAQVNVKGTRHPDDMVYMSDEDKRKTDELIKKLGIAPRK